MTYPWGCHRSASVSLSFKMKSKNDPEDLCREFWKAGMRKGRDLVCLPSVGVTAWGPRTITWIAQFRPLGWHLCSDTSVWGWQGAASGAWEKEWAGCLLHKPEGVPGSELTPKGAHLSPYVSVWVLLEVRTVITQPKCFGYLEYKYFLQEWLNLTCY